MQEKQRIISRGVAIVTAATGLLVIAKDLRSYVHLYKVLGGTLDMLGPLLTAIGFLLMLIPIAKLVAAVGLFMSKRWAWFLAVAVLTLDFIVGLQCAVRMCIFSLNHPAPMIPESDPNTVTRVVILGSTYIISVIAIVLVLILIQKPIKKQFDKNCDSDSGEAGD